MAQAFEASTKIDAGCFLDEQKDASDIFTLLGRNGRRVRPAILRWERCSSWWCATCADLAADGLRDEQKNESDSFFTEDELLFKTMRVMRCRHARRAPPQLLPEAAERAAGEALWNQEVGALYRWCPVATAQRGRRASRKAPLTLVWHDRCA